MTLDWTTLLGTVIAALLLLQLFDPETLEVYLGNRALLVVTGCVLAATLAALHLVDLADMSRAGLLALGRDLPLRL